MILLYGGYLKNHIEITYNYTHIFLSFSIGKYVGNKKKNTPWNIKSTGFSLSLINTGKCARIKKNLIKKQINFTKHDISRMLKCYMMSDVLNGKD